jgi:tetratricopeptide (TPR) repeat protein
VRIWIVVAGFFLAVVLGPFAYFYATLPPALDLTGPMTPESPIGIAYRQGQIAQQRHEYQKAVDIYTDYLARENNANWYARVVFSERAKSYEKLGQLDRAESDFTAAIKLAPSSFAYSAYADRGLFYARHDRNEEALADFKTGASHDPKNGVFAHSEGIMLADRGAYEPAYAKFSEAIQIKPKREYFVDRGSVLSSLGRHSEARADFTQALAMADKYTSAREMAHANLGRGFAELQLGLFQAAIDDFDAVLKAVPRASNAMIWQGEAYEGLGDQNHAISVYQAVLVVDPTNSTALDKLKTLQPAQR